jgi:hypothetical protein
MSYQYPTSPVPSWPYDIKAVWNTTVSAFDSGKEQRRQKNLYPKYDVSLTYPVLTEASMQIIWNFYMARKGTFEPFYFYSLEIADWQGVFIGIGDGTTVTFDLPGKSTTQVTLYKNAVALPSYGDAILTEDDGGLITEGGDRIVTEGAVDYTLHVGGGDVSADRVTFNTAPAVNDLITCDFIGYLRIRCRFQEELSRSAFTAALYQTGIKLRGLANI